MFNLNGKENLKQQNIPYLHEDPNQIFRGYRNYSNNDNFYSHTLKGQLATSPRQQFRDDNLKVADVLKDLDVKNLEIVSLNKKLQDLEKTKNEMLFDLEKYENDFQIAEKKFLSREAELNDKIRILEMEKGNLQTRLDYHLNSNSYSNFSEEYLSKENRKLKEEIYSKDEKLDLLLNFLINMQHSILNRTSNMTVLQNLDCITLRSRINEIQDEVHNLVYKKDGRNNNENYNGNSKSPILSISRNFRDISEENDKMRMRIERLNSELSQENTLKKSVGFDELKNLNLNNNYALYGDKGYSSYSPQDRLPLKSQQTFSNGILEQKLQNNSYIINNAAESAKTAGFAIPKENIENEMIIEKPVDEKARIVENIHVNKEIKSMNEERLQQMLLGLVEKVEKLGETNEKIIERLDQQEKEKQFKVEIVEQNKVDHHKIDLTKKLTQNNKNTNLSKNKPGKK